MKLRLFYDGDSRDFGPFESVAIPVRGKHLAALIGIRASGAKEIVAVTIDQTERLDREIVFHPDEWLTRDGRAWDDFEISC